MPVIARKVGRYVGKAKQFVAKVQADIDAEVDSTEIKKHLSDMDEDAPILEVFNDNKKILNDIKNDVETQQKS
jgi:sec-independent protein translocase protein TatB